MRATNADGTRCSAWATDGARRSGCRAAGFQSNVPSAVLTSARLQGPKSDQTGDVEHTVGRSRCSPMSLQSPRTSFLRAWTLFVQSPRAAMLTQAFWVALVPGALLFAWMQFRGYWGGGMLGADAHAYWLAIRKPETWYTLPPGYWDAYLYSPAFAQALWPLGQLPWRVFQVTWLVGQIAVAAWLLAPLGWRRALTIFVLLTPELVLGNLYVFYAAVLVLMLRKRPEALALPLLSKIFPGVVGLWFLVRREWRSAAMVVLTTGGAAAISMALNPSAWVGWIQFLLTTSNSGSGVQAWVRFVLAALLVVVAGRSDRPWLLAPAMVLATPILGAFTNLVPLIAIPRLLQWSRAQASLAGGAQQDVASVASDHHPAELML